MVTLTIEERSLMNEIIKSCKVCFVSMVDTDGMPYSIPMNFGFEGDIIYLHSAPEGKSINSLKNNSNVCIVFCTDSELTYQNVDVACSYRMKGSSVVCRGRVLFEENFEQKVEALDIIMKQYTEQTFTYSEPAVKNVCVWKVEMENITTKIFGVPYKESKKYRS